jgi:hypothetical protein
MAPPCTTINSLGDDMLGAIFLLLSSLDRCSFAFYQNTALRPVQNCQGSARVFGAGVQCLCSAYSCRAALVPLVCRKWYRITAHPSMWPTVDMTPRDSSVVPWLRQRSQGLRHLTLHVSIECAVFPAATAQLQCCMPQQVQTRSPCHRVLTFANHPAQHAMVPCSCSALVSR